MANNLKWRNAYGNGSLAIGLFVPGSTTYDMMKEHAPNETISQYVSGNTTAATALPGSALWGNIYFNPGATSRYAAPYDTALLMHEAIHALGPIDPQIQAALFGAGSAEIEAASVNITEKLYRDCFK